MSESSANAAKHRADSLSRSDTRHPTGLWNRPHVPAERDRSFRLHAHVATESFKAWLANLDAIGAAVEFERLEHAVEIVDRAGVVSIDPHFGVALPHLELDRADVKTRGATVARIVAAAVP